MPSTEMRKTRAGTGLGALLRPGKSRWPFSIQVEMLKGKVDISHFIFKAACGIDCVINEETSISALCSDHDDPEFYLSTSYTGSCLVNSSLWFSALSVTFNYGKSHFGYYNLVPFI